MVKFTTFCFCLFGRSLGLEPFSKQFDEVLQAGLATARLCWRLVACFMWKLAADCVANLCWKCFFVAVSNDRWLCFQFQVLPGICPVLPTNPTLSVSRPASPVDPRALLMLSYNLARLCPVGFLFKGSSRVVSCICSNSAEALQCIWKDKCLTTLLSGRCLCCLSSHLAEVKITSQLNPVT